MRLVVDVNADLRRENLPTGDEIALLIPGEYGQSSFRDIVLADRNGPGYSTIDPTHPAYLPLAYPLILPFGTCPCFFFPMGFVVFIASPLPSLLFFPWLN